MAAGALLYKVTPEPKVPAQYVPEKDFMLVLVENSLVPRRHFGFDVSAFNPLNFVPYFNFFAGFKSPQSLARGGDSGGGGVSRSD